MRKILLDTGPLVSFHSRDDAHFEECSHFMRHLPSPLYTCWPVLTEAAWLLAHKKGAIQQVFTSLSGGLIEVIELGADSITWIADFMKKYESQRAELADAALMYLAERHGFEEI